MTSHPHSTFPDLSDVTLVAVTSVAIDSTVGALVASMEQARFRGALFLSDQSPPPTLSPAIQWRKIAPLESRADYSHFMLRELGKYIGTPHALCVQWDGFVLDGSRWDPAFLEYDYIGAPWPQFSDEHRVGNGGFSLRSRRLLELCAGLPFDPEEAEDITICRTYRSDLERNGIKFAPTRIAGRFSYERLASTDKEFGFHGAFNLVKILPPAQALEVFRSLEPGVLSRRERREILVWALSRGKMRLAAEMLRSLA